MTEKSNDLSDKDKVTQNPESGELKGNENEVTSGAELSSDEITSPESEGEEEASKSSEPEGQEEASKVAAETTDSGNDQPTAETPADEILDSQKQSDSPEVDRAVIDESSASELDTREANTEATLAETPVENSTDSVNEESAEQESEEESSEEEEEEVIELSDLSKAELLALLKTKIKTDNISKVDKVVHEIKAAFEEYTNKEKESALEAFKAEGGQEDDFDFRPSEEEKEFNTYYFEFRRLLVSKRKDAEKQKEHNLAAKTEILNKLRELVDGEETTLSMATIKNIQVEWKSLGPVPTAQNRSLWANYNALMDRFYDNRSIYFELKELDRKKNLTSKLELCEKAEALNKVNDLKEAIKNLNDLHEEFKHLGPVPREDQEELWQRFKGASDAVYDRRKDFYEGQKEVYKENEVKKEELINTLNSFGDFKADRIREWNIKTKEILEIQKEWEKIGPVPRESGKHINKAFWAGFKQFFHNKNQFFKELDEIRASNQGKAEELITKAEELKENSDWQNTANSLVKLQQDWKKLGPIPEKSRDNLYKRFKNACDTFFNNRRDANKQSNAEFEDNLIKKQELCKKINESAQGDKVSEEELTGLVSEFNETGFVPRKSMKDIQTEFKTAVDAYLEKLGSEGSSREDFLFRLNLNRIQSDPNASKTLNKKEHGIRKQISELENNITLWRTNLEFFAASKTADKLKDQFDVKIQKAEDEIEKLKSKLSILREF
jgi:hypothetical protein